MLLVGHTHTHARTHGQRNGSYALDLAGVFFFFYQLKDFPLYALVFGCGCHFKFSVTSARTFLSRPPFCRGDALDILWLSFNNFFCLPLPLLPHWESTKAGKDELGKGRSIITVIKRDKIVIKRDKIMIQPSNFTQILNRSVLVCVQTSEAFA